MRPGTSGSHGAAVCRSSTRAFHPSYLQMMASSVRATSDSVCSCQPPALASFAKTTLERTFGPSPSSGSAERDPIDNYQTSERVCSGRHGAAMREFSVFASHPRPIFTSASVRARSMMQVMSTLLLAHRLLPLNHAPLNEMVNTIGTFMLGKPTVSRSTLVVRIQLPSVLGSPLTFLYGCRIVQKQYCCLAEKSNSLPDSE
ncbi:hypothetical protein K458DRAFT_127777 [Lentithecium fluviatile CBS 122367]|uniref:Uncharacterized protein n=1 Tax=Lentithecium fluviatile CBS 122367 TaxID=1168545 RepID=A0A6G1JGU0_9PLEO|nr:hypothetical protein K458DRAFT_127777 [Lentithecium fluviatile CBS 122367]